MDTSTNSTYGTALTKRMHEATNDIDRLNRAKAPYEANAKIIRCAKLLKAL